jgi:hypothetical protein
MAGAGGINAERNHSLSMEGMTGRSFVRSSIRKGVRCKKPIPSKAMGREALNAGSEWQARNNNSFGSATAGLEAQE